MSSTDPDRESERERFLALLRPRQVRLYRFLYSLLRDTHAAEDVLQETTLILWEKFESFQPGTSFFAWGAKVAYLQALKHLRQADRRAAALDPAVLEQVARQAINDRAWLDAQMRALRKCMAELRPADREVIRQRFMLHATARELAERAGRSLEAIYKAVQRIRRKLMNCVRRRLAAQAQEGPKP